MGERGIDPNIFRHMSTSEIAMTLAVEGIAKRHTRARSEGAACANCFDTGMSGGQFCDCSAGSKIAHQSAVTQEQKP